MTKINIITLTLFLTLLSPLAQAFTDMLEKDAILVPYVEMPFLDSEVIKTSGKKFPDGGCSFSEEFKLEPEVLSDDQAYVRVRRAFDPTNCEAVVEQGVVNKPLPEIAQSTATYDVIGKVIEVPRGSEDGDDMTTSSTATEQEAEGYIRYTDGRHPFIKTVRNYFPDWDGITASEANAYIHGQWSSSSSCPFVHTHWTYSKGTDRSFFWDEDDFSRDTIYIGCSSFEIYMYFKHYTEAKNDLLNIDCSEGAAITYDPVIFHLGRDGTKWLDTSGIKETGKIEQCREYLVRFEVWE